MSARPVPDSPSDATQPALRARLACAVPIAVAWGLGLVLVSLLILPAPRDAAGTPRWTGVHAIAILTGGLVGPRDGPGSWAGLLDPWLVGAFGLEAACAAVAVLRRSGTAILAFLTIFLPRILFISVLLLAD